MQNAECRSMTPRIFDTVGGIIQRNGDSHEVGMQN